MPTIRDVVHALAGREGVAAVIVLGRDGLPIDAHAPNGLDSDGLAALVPAVVTACEQLGGAANCGGFGIGVVEFAEGIVLVTELGEEALLAVVFAPGTNIGRHLFELRRHHRAIAALL
jgi:predicted regulator of Ras-like GTPase activity (Roadblock/LC7/MglB family)